MRCPRCRSAVAEPAPTLCPRCRAPLALSDEPPLLPLDASFSIDRRAPGPRAPDELSGEVGPAALVAAAAATVAPPGEGSRGGPGAGPLSRKGIGVPAPRTRPPEPPRPPPVLTRAVRATPPAAQDPAPAVSAAPPDPAPAMSAASPVAPPPLPAVHGLAPAVSAAPPAWPEPPPAAHGPLPVAHGPLPVAHIPPVGALAPSPDVTVPEPDVDVLEVHVRRAPSWRRVLAGAVDFLPFVAGGVLLARALVAAATAGQPAPTELDGLLDLVSRERVIVLSAAGAVALALAVYATLAHALAGATLGKRLLGLRVVGPDGDRPTLLRSGIRTALAGISLGLLGLGFLLALFTRSGRGLHDLLARTWVVEAP